MLENYSYQKLQCDNSLVYAIYCLCRDILVLSSYTSVITHVPLSALMVHSFWLRITEIWHNLLWPDIKLFYPINHSSWKDIDFSQFVQLFQPIFSPFSANFQVFKPVFHLFQPKCWFTIFSLNLTLCLYTIYILRRILRGLIFFSENEPGILSKFSVFLF